MVFGMLHVHGKVPGTVQLTSSLDQSQDSQSLKKGTGKNAHINLSPQPSDDPDDPLNWPQNRKNMILVSISLVASLTNAIGPMVSTAFNQISRDFDISLDKATLSTGGTFSIAIGVATFFTTAVAVKYGKRPMFVFSTIGLVVASIWAELARTTTELAIARVFQGIAAAPFETLVSATVADLYFVHERGEKLALWGLSIGAGLLLSQVGGGAVVQLLGWRKLFLITALSFVFMSFLVIFGVPETTYRRDRTTLHPLKTMIEQRSLQLGEEKYMVDQPSSSVLPNTNMDMMQGGRKAFDLVDPTLAPLESRHSIAASSIYSSTLPVLNNEQSRNADSPSDKFTRSTAFREHTAAFVASRLAQIPESPVFPQFSHRRKSHWQSLTFTVGSRSYSSISFWKLAFRPLPLLIYPAVLFTSFVNGLNYTFLLAFGLASLSLFASAPYNLSPIGVGLTAVPAVIAASIGQPSAGYATDFIARTLTRRNAGLYEPEMRLTSMLPSTLFATIGFVGFGYSIHAQQGSGHAQIWVPLIWYAIIAFSVPWTNVAAFSYLIDSHTEIANEAFVTTHFTKGVMILVVASTLNGWLAKSGVKNVFLIIAGVNFMASCFTVVFWVWGKRMRAWIARTPALRNL